MRSLIAFCVVAGAFCPAAAQAVPVGYSFALTTAYASGDPFPDLLDTSYFTEPDTGYVEIENTGDTTFEGHLGITAVSSFAGDLSYDSGPIALAPGAVVSIAVADDSKSVGGFNGPYYFYRPGVEIYLAGFVTDGTTDEAFAPLVADRDIHSGVLRTDPFGLATDSFVLQGGDPWGFDTGNAFALSQAYGQVTLVEYVGEPGSAALLAGCLAALPVLRRRRHRPCGGAGPRS